MLQDSINLRLIAPARAEMALLASAFLAPVVRGRPVGVRLGGVQRTMRVIPATYQGWGVFRPVSQGVAVLVRDASAAEKREYLERLPAVRVVVRFIENGRVLAAADDSPDSGLEISGPVDVRWVEQPELFQTIVARFDGVRFWFDRIESAAPPAATTDPRQFTGRADFYRVRYTTEGAQYTRRVHRHDLDVYSLGISLARAIEKDESPS